MVLYEIKQVDALYVTLVHLIFFST